MSSELSKEIIEILPELFTEFSIIVAELLEEDFGFTTEKTARFIDKMFEKSIVSEKTPLTKQIVQEIDRY